MAIPDDVLRAALEEYIAFGPRTRRPARERLRERLPAEPDAVLDEALATAREAVDVAYQLARECSERRRSQASIVKELARRIPWVAAGSKGTSDDLVHHLAHFGYFLVIM
jgi:hypothetical protein